jgi:Tol biopolymer transport system component
VIFASNYKATRGLPFNLMMVDLDGSNMEQITYDTMFDAFPMFSPDGKKIIFSSNRNNNGSRDTNLFIADWKD